MSRVLALVLGVVWALAGWRNLPPLDHGTAAAAGFVMASSIGLAYFAGTRRQRDLNRATATASAEATALASVAAVTSSAASVNVFVASPATVAPARAARAERYALLEDAPWMVGAHRAAEVEEEAFAVALEDVQDEREAIAR